MKENNYLPNILFIFLFIAAVAFRLVEPAAKKVLFFVIAHTVPVLSFPKVIRCFLNLIGLYLTLGTYFPDGCFVNRLDMIYHNKSIFSYYKYLTIKRGSLY